MHEVVYSLGIILLAFIWRVRDFSYYYRTFVSDDTSLEMHTTLSSMMDRFDRASSLLLMNLNMNGDGDEYEYEGEDDAMTATGRERSSAAAAAVDDAEQEMRNLHLAKPPKYTQSRQQQQQLQQQVGNSQEQSSSATTEDTNATPILVIFNPGPHATRRQHLYAALALSPTLEPPVEGDDDR